MQTEKLKTAEKTNGETIYFGTNNEVLTLKGNDKALIIRGLLMLRQDLIKACITEDYTLQSVSDLLSVVQVCTALDAVPQ